MTGQAHRLHTDRLGVDQRPLAVLLDHFPEFQVVELLLP